jgi:type I restriction enzyme R subunit
VFEKDEPLDLFNTKTGEINLAHAPDEIRFEVDQFNKKVVTPEFNRVVRQIRIINILDGPMPNLMGPAS